MRKTVAATVLAASFSPIEAAVARAGTCNENNCLRALADKDRAASAYAFCTSFLSASVPATATAGLPPYVANCGPNYVPNLSSACPCFLATATYRPSLTTSTACSTLTSTQACTGTASQPPPTCPTSVSTVTITAPGSSSTCPPPSTVTASGSATATSTFTITVPGSSGTCPPPTTITAPASPTTASCPSCPSPTTITEQPTCPLPSTATEQTTSTIVSSSTCPPPATATSTTTVTIATPGPSPSSCDQPLANSGFENPSRRTDPWQFAVSAGGMEAGVVQCTPSQDNNPTCPPGGTDGVALVLVFNSAYTPGGFVRGWQGFTPCPGPSTYRTSVNVSTKSATAMFTLTLYVYAQAAGGFGTSRALVSSRFVAGVGRQQITFDTFTTEQSSATVYLDVQSSQSDVRLWLDDFVINRTR